MNKRHKLLWPLFVCLLAASAICGTAAQAQLQKNVPHDGYFTGFAPFLDGDFKTAGELFRQAGGAGFNSTEGRWIDSICFHTMLGECYYQMGDMTNAADQYSSALKLFVIHRDWMLRAEFPATLDVQSNQVQKPTWGVSRRATRIGQFSDKYQTLQGQAPAVNQAAVEKGGVVVPQELVPVYISEIVRCTALACSRRAEILGPASQHDPLTGEVLNACLRRPGPPNHWSQCWISLQLGCAYAAAGKTNEAASELTRSLMAAETYDHPLTCLGLLELGKLAFKQGKYEAAQTYFLEASYSACVFERYDVMEEAFRYGSLTHLVSGQKGTYAPLINAAAFARQKGFQFLQASILTCLAENLATQGETQAAGTAIGQARTAMRNSEMGLGQVGARFNYENAKIQFQAGSVTAGNSSLAAAMTIQKSASKRLFQISFLDKVIIDGELTERVADLIYADILREPTAADWMIDPMDTLAVLSVPHPLPYEHWLEICLSRKEQDKALVIGDRLRRHRFYSTLPMGGRLLALRWVLEAPKESLSQAAILQRQDLLVKYPKYAELSKQAAAIKKELDELPLVPESDEDRKKQAQLLAELAKVSTAQEVILQQIALRREASDFAFPPLLEVKEIQRRLLPGQLVLAYLSTTQSVHGFAITKENYGHFRLAAPSAVKSDVVTMLRALGLFDRNQPLDGKDLHSTEWQQPAARIITQLTNGMKPEDWARYKELIVVPDSVLWYVPFEALQVPANDGGTQPLTSLVSVRYSPTVALAVRDGRGIKPLPRTAIVAGRLMPRDDDKLADDAAEEIAKAVPGTTIMPSALPAPSAIFGGTLDRLMVLSDVDDLDKGPYSFAPLALDRGKTGSTLADWSLLPFASPQQIILPAFHTAAENSLRKNNSNGDEIFLSLCGLMATGSRTILISRWRPGGQTTFDLVREFAQELPRASAAKAWHRAVQLARTSDIDPDREPRVKLTGGDAIKAEHPFFWAGYLLVDSDANSDVPLEAAPKAPAADVKKEAKKEEEKKEPEKKAEEKPAEPAKGGVKDETRKKAGETKGAKKEVK